MKVKDCMNDDIIYLMPEATIEDCAKLMENNHIGSIPVCNPDKKILGIVTDRDIILRSIACSKDVKTTPISEIMTTNVYYCFENDEISSIQNKMSKEQIRRLPVVDSNKEVIGIISIGDLCTSKNVNSMDTIQTLENICNCNRKNAE